ncbi:hypothetical protein RRG08_018446 [Elysia crispata]|uniref:DnaJ homolog subfamily C member 10 n=1 Tax=Elysia crispata TaxID=231223 RepID=A0AAE1D495_9GAST|nr:hypothetical protein RRG08_018446 [Elysia crispata]
MSASNILFLVLLASSVTLLSAGEDFYALLGVDKGASVREIRRAFKKLAISKHPDKNVDDKDAHDVFIKINRAYEVLKDEDLRKKYDQFGEEGLKEDGPHGRRYESWQYYQQDFGIYDDDPEIITLSRVDFEQSVEGTGELWFINYYSTHCSHCHDLAPTWRDVARELEGVIRIGAVNCEDDWQLCRRQGIFSYPSLLFYPQKEKYQGQRTVEALVNRALELVKVDFYNLRSSKFKETLAENSLPWLITFCGEGGDCLGKKTCVKVAAMLSELVNVGTVNCDKEASICKKLDHQHGTYYYKAGKVYKENEMEITSLYAKDVATAVMHELPDMEVIDKATLEDVVKKDRMESWLIHFVEGSGQQDLELRKLPAMLRDYNVGRADCTIMGGLCNQLHVHKFPTFLLYKANGGQEVYYGSRATAHDVAAFVQDSVDVPLENLSPDDFPERVVNGDSPWFVDFFAPWCPPCMRLLPEFKKASRHYRSKVNFGTVDCTVHSHLCNMYNIRSYPTTIMYNQSIPHQFRGQHDMHSLIEFVQDTLNPPVISLDMSTFGPRVVDKARDDVWLVDFFAPWCGPCNALAPEWRRLAKMFKDRNNIHVAQVNCQDHRNLCMQQNVNSYPTIRMYPAGSSGSGQYFGYSSWHRDAHSIQAWVYDFLPSKVVKLTSANFAQKVLDSSEPWIVDFFAPWCGHCQMFKPEFEKVAEKIEGFGHAGSVDCDEEPQACQRAQVMAYPTVRFYAGAKPGQRQNHYGWDIDSQDADYITSFIRRHAKNKSKKMKDEL